MSKFGQDPIHRNSTHLQPTHGGFQGFNRIPYGAEDAEYFQPEQKYCPQELVQGRSDSGCASRYRVHIGEVRVPRHTRVLQSWIDVFFGPLLQVADIRVCDAIRESAHVLLQCSIHWIETFEQKLRMVIWGRDVEPLVGAPGWISDEVRE